MPAWQEGQPQSPNQIFRKTNVFVAAKATISEPRRKYDFATRKRPGGFRSIGIDHGLILFGNLFDPESRFMESAALTRSSSSDRHARSPLAHSDASAQALRRGRCCFRTGSLLHFLK
jgi:hypothetical protein